MKNVFDVAKKELERLKKSILGMEKELAVKKEMMDKLEALLAALGLSTMRKRGRKPAAEKKPADKPAKRGRKPGPKPKAKKAGRPKAGPRPGRKRQGEDTLPLLIVDTLKKAGQPMNAKEILAQLQKKGWQTNSGDPQGMVYKTLHRIEKSGMVAKAARGKFTAGK
ncbi:MAG: hypothetical protein GX444_12715 [Myxococcales bacterium]|nr:hypothetical protein [Myxococcales bacterium]